MPAPNMAKNHVGLSDIYIIIPIFNEEKNIPKLLKQLAHLQAPCLFVDGESQDGSYQLLQQAGATVIHSKKGRAQQMNYGAAHCQASILVFLHADTVLENKHLHAIQKSMSCFDVVAGRFDIRLSGHQFLLRVVEYMINLRSRISHISTGDQVIFVRKTVFDAIGGFPHLPIMEDIALSRCLKHQGNIACLKEKITTSSRRWEERGIVTTICLMWWLRFLFFLGVPAHHLHKYYVDQR